MALALVLPLLISACQVIQRISSLSRSVSACMCSIHCPRTSACSVHYLPLSPCPFTSLLMTIQLKKYRHQFKEWAYKQHALVNIFFNLQLLITFLKPVCFFATFSNPQYYHHNGHCTDFCCCRPGVYSVSPQWFGDFTEYFVSHLIAIAYVSLLAILIHVINGYLDLESKIIMNWRGQMSNRKLQRKWYLPKQQRATSSVSIGQESGRPSDSSR